MAQNVKFIKGDTAKINGTSVTDGQLLYNTTTGQHYIDNGSTRVEVGKPEKPVVNTSAEVLAITADNIPCGTKPVKELIKNLNEWVNGIDVRYNTPLSRAEWSVRGADTWNPFSKMPPQMYTADGSFPFVPSVKWFNNEFTISLYSRYYVAFDVRNFTKMKINAFSSYSSHTSALFSDTVLNTTESTSNTLIRTFLTAITTPIEIDISSYDFITLCAYGSGSDFVRYSGYGGLFTGVSFE